MATCWVRLKQELNADWSGDSQKIRPAPDDISDLRDAVKKAFAAKLDRVDASDLKVFPPGDHKELEQPLAADASVPGGSSAQDPIRVVFRAPAPGVFCTCLLLLLLLHVSFIAMAVSASFPFPLHSRPFSFHRVSSPPLLFLTLFRVPLLLPNSCADVC
jgi:hypothetical protein